MGEGERRREGERERGREREIEGERSLTLFETLHQKCRKIKPGAGATAAGAEPPPPPPPAAAAGEPMPGGMTGLNMYCAKYRDKPDDKKKGQLKTMALCMAQDCEQSMEEVGCVYVTPGLGGLCYTNPGQNWCSENPSSADCVEQERPGGLWQPVQDLAFTGKVHLHFFLHLHLHLHLHL